MLKESYARRNHLISLALTVAVAAVCICGISTLFSEDSSADEPVNSGLMFVADDDFSWENLYSIDYYEIIREEVLDAIFYERPQITDIQVRDFDRFAKGSWIDTSINGIEYRFNHYNFTDISMDFTIELTYNRDIGGLFNFEAVEGIEDFEEYLGTTGFKTGDVIVIDGTVSVFLEFITSLNYVKMDLGLLGTYASGTEYTYNTWDLDIRYIPADDSSEKEFTFTNQYVGISILGSYHSYNVPFNQVTVGMEYVSLETMDCAEYSKVVNLRFNDTDHIKTMVSMEDESVLMNYAVHAGDLEVYAEIVGGYVPSLPCERLFGNEGVDGDLKTYLEGCGTLYDTFDMYQQYVADVKGDKFDKKYSIIFDPNGATSGQMDNSIVNIGLNCKLPNNQFEKEFNIFAGWNTKKDGSGTSYDDGAYVDLTDESGDVVTLYAQWEPKPLTNGETFNMYGIKYRVISAEDRTLAVIGYTSDDVDIIIPEKIIRGTECTVIAINDFAFEDANIESISLPDSIEWIGCGAFSFCMRLTTFEVPASMTDIEMDAFYFCLGLTEFTVSPENEKYESKDGVLFDKVNKSLVLYPANRPDKEYVVPVGTLSLEKSSFTASLNLVELVLPEGLKKIESYAIELPFVLESINIPASVTEIELFAIICPESLVAFEVDSENDSYSSIAGVLYELNVDGDAGRLICYPAGKMDESYTVPSTVIYIDDSAFWNAKFKALDLGNLESITPYLFAECYFLETVRISENTTISEDALDGSPTVKEYIVDEDNPFLSSLDGVLFSKDKTVLLLYPGAKTDTHYELPDTVTSIWPMAFNYAYNLKSIDLGEYEGDLFNLRYCGIEYYLDRDYEIVAEEPYSGVIYLKMTPDIFTVTLDPNGGALPDDAEDSIEYIYGDKVVLPTPVREGYAFLGWYWEGLLFEYRVELDGWLYDDVDVVAKWLSVSPTVTFDPNGGTLSQGSETKDLVYSKKFGELPVPTKVGYEFVGWFTSITGGDEVTSESIVDIIDEATLYAHWEQIMLSVSFTVDGVAIDGYPKEMGMNSVIVAPDVTPVKESTMFYDYVFIGWKGFEEGMILDTSKVFIAEFREVAKITSLTVTFDPNGGTLPQGSETKELEYDDEFGDLPVPTKVGYEFVGWYTSAIDGDRITSASVVDTIGEMTIYAHWEQIMLVVSFTVDGVAIDGYPKELGMNSVIVAPDIVPTKDSTDTYDYVFIGWNGFREGIILDKSMVFAADFRANLKMVAPPSDEGNVSIEVEDTHEVLIPETVLEDLKQDVSEGVVNTVEVTLPLGSIGLDSKVIAEIEVDTTIVMKTADVSEVGEHAVAVADRPLVEVSVGDKHEFNGGKITIVLAYALREGESAEGLIIWHFDDDGDYEKESCTYDAQKKQVSFTVDSLSKFAIMYQEPPADEDGDDEKGIFFYIGIGVGVLIVAAGVAIFLMRRKA